MDCVGNNECLDVEDNPGAEPDYLLSLSAFLVLGFGVQHTEYFWDGDSGEKEAEDKR